MNTDLVKFKQKIRNGEPFAIIRPGDGEYLICTNSSVTTQDNWTFTSGSCLQTDLLSAIKECETLPIYIGIPCKHCSEHIYNWYTQAFSFPNERLTYANIFCNKNWSWFTSLFLHENLPFYYIGPYVSNKYNLTIVDVFTTDSRLVNLWDANKESFLTSLKEWIREKTGIFLFSVGPISKIVIPMLYKLNPNNIYLDVGSSMDLFMKGESNRGYIDSNNPYANILCDFEKGHIQPADITAILTLYKRPHCLREQLDAVYAQTCVPNSIIVVRNYVEGVELPKLPSDITVIDCSKNFGVWTRFAIGLLANTEYICVFDDDTIPGIKWFENCLHSMSVREGLYGTIGIKFPTSNYSFSLSDRVGWDNPNEEIVEVDIVGHAWFFKRQWLHYLWQYTPSYRFDLTCAEDINLSFQLQKVGIPTFVPPHPPNNIDFYGSHPQKAWKYGCDANAISSQPTTQTKFEIALCQAIASGFKLLCMKTN